MKFDELYKYFEKKKDDFIYSKKIKFSKCYKNWFQISLVKNNKPYLLSNIHYEITKGEKEDSFIFNIHFEEFDTTRYKKNKKLTELADKNELEYFSWWTGKTKKNNQNNESLKSKSIVIKTEEDADKFIDYLNNIFKQFNDLLLEIEENGGIVNMKTKNIMLYGAPGVGKTHNYKRLITMIENGNDEKTIFDTISRNGTTNDFDNSIFEDIKKEKRIEFVTFHQSYSYEDFIEGFRPSENTHIELEDGIFKLLCNKAKNQIKETIYQHISFDEAFDILRTKYIENELDKIFSVSNVEIVIHEFKDKTIKVQSSNAKDTQYVKKSDLETVVQAILNNEVQKPSDIKKLDVKKDTISLGGLYYPIGKKIIEIINETKNSIEEKEKNFYIVIDEINRGNISKIFGELITLIEEDKRDTYEVTLPYSKEKFKIPSNLYIIATMNSTDKSIATIDIALRRRFTFLKMKPNLDLVKNVQANKLMKELNEHISKTINEDYALGHSYFMKIEKDEHLEFVKEYKIKPLLEEYFYGDEENYKKAITILEFKNEPNKQ
jgi:5-methylcytosine-specific restriction enzyme B